MDTLIHFVGPLHPPLVHFPVVCPILAFLALTARIIWKKEWLAYSAAALWVITFFSAFAALISGHLFALHLGMVPNFSLFPPESAMKGQLREHALLGTASLLFSFLALAAARKIFQGRPWPLGLQLVLGFFLAVGFGLTGHEGGEMVYGLEENLSVPAASLSSASSSEDLLVKVKNYRQTLVKMNSKLWRSKTHGNRWVNTYVSKEAVEAYKNSNPMPVGSLVVKESFEDKNGKPSEVEGPLYVMEKGQGSIETGGWRYALSWKKPVAGNPEGIHMPVQWLPGDDHLNSCVKCHNHFKTVDYVGGVPSGFDNP